MPAAAAPARAVANPLAVPGSLPLTMPSQLAAAVPTTTNSASMVGTPLAVPSPLATAAASSSSSSAVAAASSLLPHPVTALFAAKEQQHQQQEQQQQEQQVLREQKRRKLSEESNGYLPLVAVPASVSETNIAAIAALSLATSSSSLPSLPASASAAAPVPAANTKVAAVPGPVLIPEAPAEYWQELLHEWQIPLLDTAGIEDEAIPFVPTTPERIEAYQNIDLLSAVRRRDLKTLHAIAAKDSTTTMNACNRFGESILHLACRKGSADVLHLLAAPVAQGGCACSLLVRDDYGRTILHDACWTVTPNWTLIQLLLKTAPVLWRVADVRGHLALQYVPKSVWPKWILFLQKNKPILQRVMRASYFQQNSNSSTSHHNTTATTRSTKSAIAAAIPQPSSTTAPLEPLQQQQQQQSTTSRPKPPQQAHQPIQVVATPHHNRVSNLQVKEKDYSTQIEIVH